MWVKDPINPNKDVLISNKEDAYWFLEGLGFDKFDIEEFITILCSEYEDDKQYWMEEAQEFKADLDVEYELRTELVRELRAMINELDGRDPFSQNIADQLSYLCETYGV